MIISTYIDIYIGSQAKITRRRNGAADDNVAKHKMGLIEDHQGYSAKTQSRRDDLPGARLRTSIPKRCLSENHGFVEFGGAADASYIRLISRLRSSSSLNSWAVGISALLLRTEPGKGLLAAGSTAAFRKTMKKRV